MPAEYRVGEIVRVRDAVWRVANVRHHRTCQALRLLGAELGNRGLDRTFLVPFDRPARIAISHRARVVSRRRLVSAISAAMLARPPWGSLAAAVDARVDLLPYQLEPALAVLRGKTTRVLLADEVGLGKTIQAGLVLSELTRRGEADRALVLTPAGLRRQWADELAGRFGLDAVVADTAWLRRAVAALPQGVNPWSTPRVLIASFDFIKRPEVLHALQSLIWDLVIVDEAHAVAGASDRHRSVHGLARGARRVVLITATPHAGDERAFASLCGLGAFEPDERDPLVMFCRTRAEAGFGLPRRTRVVPVRPTGAERRMHRLLERYTTLVWREASARADREALLAMIVLRKRALSSAASLAASAGRRAAWLAGEPDDRAAQLPLPFDPDGERDPEDQAPHQVLAAAGLSSLAREIAWLRAVETAARDAARRESKVAVLRRLLCRTREPAVVFTEYRDTLARLERALAPLGGVAVLHGGLTGGERGAAVAALNSGRIRLLLATDAGSEGLNLQARCRWVINFELPWSPARLEQRLGRVDRLGQTLAPHGTHLVARDTAESLVLRNLSSRLTRVARTMGERAMALGAIADFAMASRILGGVTAGPAPPVDVQVTCRPSRPDQTLSTDAAIEARRLLDLRRLARLACRRSPAARDDPMPAMTPVAGRLRARGRRRSGREGRLPRGVLCVFAASLVDELGRPVDSQTAIVHAPRAGPAGVRGWRAALDAQLGDLRRSVSHALLQGAEDRLRTILPLQRAAVDRLAQRWARVVDHARRPLARPLVQPGLFDRRATTEAAEAQRTDVRLTEEAERYAADLRARVALRVGAVELLAAAAIE